MYILRQPVIASHCVCVLPPIYIKVPQAVCLVFFSNIMHLLPVCYSYRTFHYACFDRLNNTYKEQQL